MPTKSDGSGDRFGARVRPETWPGRLRAPKVELAGVHRDLVFDDVHFRCEQLRRPILNGVSFHAHRGETDGALDALLRFAR